MPTLPGQGEPQRQTKPAEDVQPAAAPTVAPPAKSNPWIVAMSIIIAGALVGAGIYFSTRNSGTGGNQTNTTVDSIMIRPVSSTDHILGNPNAPVTIIEFSDTECPFCKEFQTTMQNVMQNYGTSGKVAWVYRQMPIDALHQRARHEAEATECAASLGGNTKFWAYLNEVFAKTNSNDTLDPAELPVIATDVGLDQTQFNNCLSANKFEARINADIQDGTNAGARGTPYSVLLTAAGDKIAIIGAQPYDVLKAIIDSALGGPTQ